MIEHPVDFVRLFIDILPYKIDRMLNHLKMAGKLSDAAGILLCDFHDCIPKKRSESLTLKEIIEDYMLFIDILYKEKLSPCIDFKRRAEGCHKKGEISADQLPFCFSFYNSL